MRRGPLFLGLILCAAMPARATISQTTYTNLACGHVTPCGVAVSGGVTAGSSMIAIANNQANSTLTMSAGASGGGTWIITAGCTTVASCTVNNGSAATGSEYVLVTTGTPTTVNCTATTAVIDACAVIVVSSNGLTFDVGKGANSATGTNQAGESAGTLTGTNDIIIQYGVFTGDATACPNSAASPATPDGNGDYLACGLINSTNNAAGTYTNTSSTAGKAAIAFKESAANKLKMPPVVL